MYRPLHSPILAPPGLFCMLGFALAVSAQETPDVVERCIEAYGGAEAIGAASAFVQTGEILSPVRGGGPGRILRAFHRPDKLRVEVVYPDGDAEVRVLMGGRGWRGGKEIGGPLHSSMALQAIRLDLPAFLLAAREQISVREAIERDGRTFSVLELEVGDGMSLMAEIDPATGRVHRTIAHIAFEGAPHPLEFINEYSDFREVNGVLFAFHEITYAQGRHTADIRLEDIRTFDVIPAEHFDPGPSPKTL